ncbi:MAG: hypothetical protein WA790_11150 [Sulfitobacter sp.]
MRNDMYMITCSARTGSSLLETSLLSHPDIQSSGEVYNPNRVSSLRGRYTSILADEAQCDALTKYRDANQTAFLYKYVFDAQGKKAVGLKLKHEELLLPKFAETREAIRKDTYIKVIHLRRKNLFARFVSLWLATKVTGVTEIHSEDKRPEITTVNIPIRDCHMDFDRSSARYDFFRKMYQEHPSLEVTYEDLAGPDQAAEFARVQEFLGVTPQSLSSKLRKVVNKDLRQIVENYDELAAHFAPTRYAEFFQE